MDLVNQAPMVLVPMTQQNRSDRRITGFQSGNLGEWNKLVTPGTERASDVDDQSAAVVLDFDAAPADLVTPTMDPHIHRPIHLPDYGLFTQLQDAHLHHSSTSQITRFLLR
jgi:hypothetical protein